MRSYIYLTALAAIAQAAADASDVDCDCYLTNGTVPAYYSEHLFFDFRDLSKYAGVPKPINNDSASARASASSDYFESDDWTNTWNLQNWTKSSGNGVSLSGDASVLMVNSPSNVYIEKNDDDDPTSATWLAMRTMRLPGFQTAAEFESVSSDYQFLSLRMFARTIGASGACTAMFTYKGAEEVADVQEADIEILTRGPRNKIQYTNQPSFTDDGDDIPESTLNASLPGKSGWDDWLVHRLDWTPERSVWYVDGEEVANIEFQTPKDPAQVIFNAWSDGGTWSGKMALQGEAYLQIQWIEMVYNKTDSDDGDDEKRSIKTPSRRDLGPAGKLLRRKDDDNSKCSVVCSIDQTDETGLPKMLWNSTAPRLLGTGIVGGNGAFVWTLLAALILFFSI